MAEFTGIQRPDTLPGPTSATASSLPPPTRHLEKSFVHLQPANLKQLYEFVEQLATEFLVERLCSTLNSSRSAYYTKTEQTHRPAPGSLNFSSAQKLCSMTGGMGVGGSWWTLRKKAMKGAAIRYEDS